MTEPYLNHIKSEAFLSRLGLPAGTELKLSLLGQGEYNLNYSFAHPATGQKLVLRINKGSQMHLEDQIGYEYSALCDLAPSGRTPKPLFCDRDMGILVMEWLPGRALIYENKDDMQAAAGILADIHSTPVPKGTKLIRPAFPAMAIYEECLDMAQHYLSWDKAGQKQLKLINALISEIGKLPMKEPSSAPLCMVNTELNSGNFLINPHGQSYLVDWEKPLLSEPAQDLGHFLAPTTTFWKTDTILTPAQVKAFADRYIAAVNGRMDCSALAERLPLFFTVTCLRGITWCAMAYREYSEPGRELTNADTFEKLKAYMAPEFLQNILESYVLRDFLS